MLGCQKILFGLVSSYTDCLLFPISAPECQVLFVIWACPDSGVLITTEQLSSPSPLLIPYFAGFGVWETE